MLITLNRFLSSFTSSQPHLSNLPDSIEMLMAAAKIGLFPKIENILLRNMNFHHFEKKAYILEMAQKKELDELVKLENASWPKSVRANAHELKRRISAFPQGQFVIKVANRIAAVVYTQKISSISSLEKITFKKNHKLHRANGKIVRLLGISVAPEFQDSGLGDQLMEFVLCWSILMGDIQKIAGVTRCKNYIDHNHLSIEDYIQQHNNTAGGLDSILRFHTSRGAMIKGIVANYRPEDTDNKGAGVLIEYDLAQLSFPKQQIATETEMQLASQAKDHIAEQALQCIKKLLPPASQADFSPMCSLMDMGFDSLTLLELRLELNKTFQLELDSAFFFEFNTPQAIAQHLENKLNPVSAHENTTEAVDRNSDEKIAIIGIGCRFPNGIKNTRDFWDLLSNGKDAVTPIPEDRQSFLQGSMVQGGFLQDIAEFDAKFFHITTREAELMDPQQRILLETTWEALEDAAMAPSQLMNSKTGVFIGMFSNDYASLLTKNKSSSELDIYYATGNASAIAAGRLAYTLGLQGPTLVVDTACSSSLVAVHLACQSIRAGECEIALAGGVNIILSSELNNAFTKAGMLSPDGKCKTFDASANGYVRSEGAGMIVCKKLSKALQDGDHVLAVIRSSAINQDGASNGLTAPNKAAQEALLRTALNSAQLKLEDIDYIETHGTGTSLGDPVEVKAISDVFLASGNRTHPLILGAVKSNIGHTEAAAGIAGLIKTVLMLQHQQIPANIHFSELNPHILKNPKLSFPAQLTDWQSSNNSPLRAGVNSFGFSGTNAHVIIESAPISQTQAMTVKSAYLIILSAKSESALKEKIRDLNSWLAPYGNDAEQLTQSQDKQLWHDRIACSEFELLDKLSYTLMIGRDHFEKRFAVVVRNIHELQLILQQKIDEGTPLSQSSSLTATEFKLFSEELKNLEFLSATEYREKLNRLAQFYCAGFNFDGSALNLSATHTKIPLPTYPFERKTYWFKPSLATGDNMPIPTITLDTLSPNYREEENTPYSGNEVTLEILNENIAVVKMSDKLHRNMLTKELFCGLRAKFKQIKESNQIKVVILTGYDNVFCMGGDEESLKSISDKKMQFTDLAFVYRGLLECEVPVITAIQGHAHGGGLAFGLYGDIIILSEENSYAASFMQYGFTPGVGATYILKEKLGNVATEMMYTAKLFTGLELKARTGSVIIKKQEEVLKEAIAIAMNLAEKPLPALKALKQEMAKKILTQLPSVLQIELEMHAKTFSSAEVKEKITATFNHNSSMQLETAPSFLDTLSNSTILETPPMVCHPERREGSLDCTSSDPSSQKRSQDDSVSQHLSRKAKVELQETTVKSEATVKLTPTLSLETIQQAIITIMSKVTFNPADEIAIDLSFGNMGIDSIAAVEITREINHKFSLSLEAANLYSHPSIEKLSQHVYDKAAYLQELQQNIQGGSMPTIAEDPIPIVMQTTHHEAQNEAPTVTQSTNHAANHPTTRDPQVILYVAEPTSQPSADVAIVGISGRFPDADNIDQFWENLIKGVNSIKEIPSDRWNKENYYDADAIAPNKTYSRSGAFLTDIDKFDPAFFNISPKEAEMMDPQQRLFLQEAWRAIEDAGYTDHTLSGSKCGVFVGVSPGDYGDLLNKAGLKNTALAFTGLSPAILAARISYFLNLKGPSLAIDTACSSSLVAVHQAYESILAGHCEMAIAGGVSLMTTPQTHIMTTKAGMLSPTDSCRTFDDTANGIVLGEGVGAVVLKPLNKAISDGNHIYGVIKASGINQDGLTSSITAPNPESQTELEINVYKKAKINPENISYVETHGTGTALGDPIEISALTQAHRKFTQKNNYAALGSVKTNIGHTTMAAGIASLIKVLLAFKHNQIPPQIGFNHLNHHIQLENSPFYISNQAITWNRKTHDAPRYATVSSFGFSGTNAHILLSDAPISQIQASSKTAYLLTFSAKTEKGLSQRIRDLSQWLTIQSQTLSLADLSYTLNAKRSHFDKRCAVIISSINELKTQLQDMQNGVTTGAIFGSTQHANLQTLANEYVHGNKIDWDAFYQGEPCQIISLPTYPFAKDRYWFDSFQSENSIKKMTPIMDLTKSKLDVVTVQITDEGIAIVEMHDRQDRNQLSLELLHALEARFQEIKANPIVKVVVLTGYDDIFCLGGSEEGLLSVSKGEIKYTDMPFIYRGLLDCDTPVISAMQGHAFGAGLAFGLYADLVIMSENHLYTANFMKYGFTPGVGSTLILTEKLTEAIATEMMWTAKEYQGIELKTRGASVMFKPGNHVLDEAMHLAKMLAKKPRQALTIFKKDRSQGILNRLTQTIERELQMHSEIFASPEATANIENYFSKLTHYNQTITQTSTKPTTLESTSNIQSHITLKQTAQPTYTQPCSTQNSGTKLTLKSTTISSEPTAASPSIEKNVTSVANSIVEHNPKNNNNTITQTLLSIISQKLHISTDNIDTKRSFNEMGVDSISAVEVIRELNDTFHLSLEAAAIYDYPTIKQLADCIAKEMPQSSASLTEPDSEKKKPSASSKAAIAPTDIAIIGYSGRFPGADDLERYWENLSQGCSSITEIPKNRWAIDNFYDQNPEAPNKSYSKWGGFLNNIDQFDPLFFGISPAQAEQMDPQQRLLLEECWKVFEIAGYSPQVLQGQKCAVFIGAGTGDYAQRILNATPDANSLMGINPSILAARIAYHLDLKGPSVAIDTACSSSLVAIHQACQSLWSGENTMALAGGVCIFTTPQMHVMTSKAGMLSQEGLCKTFDNAANGFVPGEGVGVVLLKPLAAAIQDNDLIHAVIKASGINQDGKTNGITAPSMKSQTALELDVYNRFNINPETISYVEAHGTGTKLGDPIEISALTKAFNQSTFQKQFCGIGSVKTNIGHALYAAGIASVIKMILCFKHKKMVPSLNFSQKNEHINFDNSPFYVNTELKEWHSANDIRRTAISSFGFSGTNAHLVMEEAPENDIEPIHSRKPFYLLTLSAQTEACLKQRINDLSAWLNAQTLTEDALEAISYTLNDRRAHFEWRCAIVVGTIKELHETLAALTQDHTPENTVIQTSLQNQSTDELPENVYVNLSERDQLLTLAQFYIAGYDLDWKRIHSNEAHHRIILPTYPFAKERYWFAEPALESQTIATTHQPTITNTSSSDQDNIISQIKKLTAEILKLDPQKLDITKALSAYGMDSITMTTLTHAINHEFNLALTPAILFEHPTLESYAAFIYSNHIKNQSIQLSHAKTTIEPHHKNNDIAVIGISGIFPGAKDTETFWKNLINGINGISTIPSIRQDLSKHADLKWGGFIDGIDEFDASFFNISPREAELMDPQQRLFLQTTWKTIEDAGYALSDLSKVKTGIFVGVVSEDYAELLQRHDITDAAMLIGNARCMIANRVSYLFNLTGPSEVIDTACSSSLVAIHRAIQAIQNGDCDVAVAGGVNALLSATPYLAANKAGMLNPEGQCRTFDSRAQGYVRAEGSAAILLKPLAQAEQDGDHIYGVIKGSATNHGGHVSSLTVPNPNAQAEVIQKACEKAHIDIDTLSYIEAHGTGTSLGDPIEINGLKKAFQQLALKQNKNLTNAYCALGSVKSNIGHAESVAGVIGVIKVLLALQHQSLPGHLNLEKLNPYIELDNSPFYIVKQTQAWQPLTLDHTTQPRRAGVSSFGFGGVNAHLILEEAPNSPCHAMPLAGIHNAFHLITLSAKHLTSLKQRVTELKTWLEERKHSVDLESLAFTLNTGRMHFDLRCAWVVNSSEELLQALETCDISSVKTHKTTQDLSNQYQQLLTNFSNVDATTYHQQLMTLAELYKQGYPINFSEFFKKGKRLQIPTYPFLPQRFWFEPNSTQNDRMTQQTSMYMQSPCGSQSSTQAATLSSDDLHEATLHYLKTVFSEKLKISIDQIVIDSTYEIYGVDSIFGLDIIKRLEDDLGTLPKTILYEKNRLVDLAIYLQKKHQNKLIELLSTKESTLSASTQSDAATVAIASHVPTPHEDIAIIGISGTYPEAENLQVFWENLARGKDCISEVPIERWNYKDYPVTIGGETKYQKHGGFIPDIDKFDPLFFNISPRDAALMDPQERLFMQTAWATLEDAGYTREGLQQFENNVGVFVGVTYNFYPLFIAEEWQKGNRIPLDVQLFSIANRMSYFLNANGPSFVIDTACSSSASAIHLAYESILRGECKMAIAGGVNLSLHPSKYHMLGSYSFMSDQGRCTSFGANGNGYVPGEGVGAVLLKPLSLALKDKDQIYGVIKASSMNHGGKTSGYTVPNPSGQSELIKTALRKAGINPRTVSYIEAHGTGTALGDPIEIRGLQDAFEDYTQDKQFCAIGSVKSNIGHLESAAGISQLTKVILQLKHKQLVPSLHAKELNPFIEFEQTPFSVQQELTSWDTQDHQPRRAGISSFGAGGANVHFIVEEFTMPPLSNTGNAEPYLFLVSAQDADRLHDYVKNIVSFLKIESQYQPTIDTWLHNICYTSQIGREAMTARLAILANSYQDLLTKLEEYLNTHSASQNIWINHTSKPCALTNLKPLSDKNHAALAENWVAGAKIAWEKLHDQQERYKAAFPTYPFAKRRCWISTIAPKVESVAIQSATKEVGHVLLGAQDDSACQLVHQFTAPSQQNAHLNEWMYQTQWEPKSLDSKKLHSLNEKHFLLFGDSDLTANIQSTLGFQNHPKACHPERSEGSLEYKSQDESHSKQRANITTCTYGKAFQKIDEQVYTINPLNKDAYLELFSTLAGKEAITDIIFIADFLGDTEPNLPMFHLLKTLSSLKTSSPIHFTLITRNSQAVTPTDPVHLWHHHLKSLVQVFAAENPLFKVLCIDLDNQKSLIQDAELIKHEIECFHSNENHIAYRNTKRYILTLQPYSFPQNSQQQWQAPTTALITGGLGALGSEVANWLAREGTRYLLLTGTTQLPPKTEWSTITDDKLKQKITEIINLEKQGITVNYAAIDITNKPAMKNLIKQTEHTWNASIEGVFHLAGITTDNITLENMTQDLFEKVLNIKIQGAMILHELFDKNDLNSFVLFSSTSALPYFGIGGLSAYAMANDFLNGLALFRHQQGLPATSINWTAWAEKGMSFNYNHSAFLEAVGLSTLPLATGIDILKKVLQQSQPVLSVLKADWDKCMRVNPEFRKLAFFKNFTKETTPSSVTLSLNQEDVTQTILTSLAELLGLTVSEIDPQIAFQQYGMDSIVGVNFVANICEKYPDSVSPMDLYRYPSTQQLVDYILQSHHSASTIESTEVTVETSNEDNFLQEIDKLTDEELEKLLEKELSEIKH